MTVFPSLKDKCEYYRSKTDIKLEHNSYTMVMLDGRSFSKKIKKKYKLPFDDTLIEMMNQVAVYVCKNVQGCKVGYVQSDEISLVITDFETPEDSLFFGGRLVKMLSIIPSLATGEFNRLAIMNGIPVSDGHVACSADDILGMIAEYDPVQFDAKVWQVPNLNDCYAWFLYRQIDCIRNSKQQHAQYYLSHNQLVGKDCDEQVKMVLDQEGVDWNDYDPGKKFGRFIWREDEQFQNDSVEYTRSVWRAYPGWDLKTAEGKEKLISLIPDNNK